MLFVGVGKRALLGVVVDGFSSCCFCCRGLGTVGCGDDGCAGCLCRFLKRPRLCMRSLRMFSVCLRGEIVGMGGGGDGIGCG